jgi:N-methylhydantoinase A
VAFGGAGGLHAAALARSLGMPAALVPALPGALSAWGMAGAEAIRDAARTALEPLAAWPAKRRREAFRELSDAVRAELGAEGHAARAVRVELSLDLRYRGQSYELHLPDGPHPTEAFHAAHEALNGYRLETREVELVCLRARGSVQRPVETAAAPRRRKLPARAVTDELGVDFGRTVRAVAVDRRELAPGHAFEGPALVEEYSGTTLVPPGWAARVTAGGHLLLEPTRT